MTAAKLNTVLSYRVALAPNSLILAKTFSIQCWSRSKLRGPVRFVFGGITDPTPDSANISSKASESKASSSINLSHERSERRSGIAMRSWLWLGRTTKRTSSPTVSVNATIWRVKPSFERPIPSFALLFRT